MYDNQEFEKEIAQIDLTSMTPLAALNELDRLQKIIKQQG